MQKTPKAAYTKERLDAYLKRDGATLVNEPPIIRSATVITFLCECGTERTKRLEKIKEEKAMCPACKKAKFGKPAKPKKPTIKRGWDKARLDVSLKRDNATLIGEYPKITAHLVVTFVCECGNEQTKKACEIEKHEARCKECTSKQQQQKKKDTCLKLHGDEHPIRLKEFQDKRCDTNVKRHGNEHPCKTEKCKKKTVATCNERFGFDNHASHPEVKAKTAASKELGYLKRGSIRCNKKSLDEALKRENATLVGEYGRITKLALVTFLCECGLRNTKTTYRILTHGALCEECSTKSWHGKLKARMLELYGVEYAMQNPILQAKLQESSFNMKAYIFPSGNTRYVQGYEPFCIDDLLGTYTEDQLVTGCDKVPRIPYFDEITNKQRYYFPDIHIPHENRLIEVKSAWTYGLENVQAKAKAAKKQGYLFEFWIYNRKAQRIEM